MDRMPCLGMITAALLIMHAAAAAPATDKLALSSSKSQWGTAIFCSDGRIAQDGACYQPFALGCFCFNALCSASSPYCTSYFRDTGSVNTDEWNIWSYSVPLPSPTEESTTLLVVSDPQPFRYQLNQSDGTPSGGQVGQVWEDSVQANYDVLRVAVASHSIAWPDTKATLYPNTSATKYLEINGDLTEYWHYSQLSAYRQMYEVDFNPGPMALAVISGVSSIGSNIRTFPVLGNHDYVNNVGNCEGVDGDCSANAIKWLRTLLSPYNSKNKLDLQGRGNANFGWDEVYGFDADSLMYYYRINKYIIFNLGFVLNDGNIIKFNSDWLKQHVKEAHDAGYNILIFSHAAPGDDSLQWPQQQLCDAIKDVPVAGIMVGHVHNMWGLIGNFDSSGCWFEPCGTADCQPSWGKIPMWRIGAPDYRLLMAVRLDPSSYTVGWLSAPTGEWSEQFRNGAGEVTATITGVSNSNANFGDKVTKLVTCKADSQGDCSSASLPFGTPELVVPPPSPPPQPPMTPPPKRNTTHAAAHAPPSPPAGTDSSQTTSDLFNNFQFNEGSNQSSLPRGVAAGVSNSAQVALPGCWLLVLSVVLMLK